MYLDFSGSSRCDVFNCKAINDPIVGLLIDRTNSKWGRFRPYLLFGAIPFAVLAILYFTTPWFSGIGKLIYA